jgi:hypothetical protein
LRANRASKARPFGGQVHRPIVGHHRIRLVV